MNDVDIDGDRLTARSADVGLLWPSREIADVDRISIAREVAEDRGPVRWSWNGWRTGRGGGRA
jgi:hypothetical protein